MKIRKLDLFLEAPAIGGGGRGEDVSTVVSGGEGGVPVCGGGTDGLGGEGVGGVTFVVGAGKGAVILEGGGARRAVSPSVGHLSRRSLSPVNRKIIEFANK